MNRAADSISNNAEIELPHSMELWKRDQWGKLIRNKWGQLVQQALVFGDLDLVIYNPEIGQVVDIEKMFKSSNFKLMISPNFHPEYVLLEITNTGNLLTIMNKLFQL